MDFLKSTAKREIFFGVIYLLIGIFFVLRPDTAFSTIGNIFSIIILIVGIINICMYFTEKNFLGTQRNGLAAGLILSIIAIYFLIRPDFIATLLGFIIGFMILIAGITQLQNAIDMIHFKAKNWIFMLITAGILIILGIISLINPFSADRALIFTTGIFIIICAAIKILSTFMFLMGARTVEKATVDGDIIDEDEDKDPVKAGNDTDSAPAEDKNENDSEETPDEKKDEAPVFNEDI